ncbi:glycosyltransferase family 4 protein [Siminovitchia sp. 179-K 8D1 HS]|uniref:glycosyltransferase family 4 protein n=1 Tax=Siminovitchia sp. 179-K 8D1 HS TaxID=3142385 RepID=UPI00399F35AA
MKVCFFTHYSYTNQDGATLSLINIVNEMVERGIEVIVVIPNKNIQFPIKHEKVKCIVIPAFSMRVPIHYNGIMSYVKGKVKSLRNWFSMKKALSIIKEERPDIIHINGLDSGIGAEVAIKLGIPYFWHIRQLLDDDLGLRLYNEKKIYKLLKKAQSIIAISKTIKEKYEKILNKNLVLIYNGIPIEKYRIDEKIRFSKKVINILLAGRIVEKKGQLDAVKAVSHLVKSGTKNIQLILAGNAQDINYTKTIKEFIYAHNLQEFIKIIDHVEDLRQLRSNCDIGLICSKKEAFGRVTIETMLSRMLAIGANTGGTAEIIDNNVNGLLYQEGDYLSLAKKIEYAIANKDEMNTLIDLGYKTVIERYSISRVVDQIINLYEEVMSGRLDKEVS